MEIITLTKENLSKEHICCAISNNNDIQVSTKKAWLEKRLDEGLMFKKGDVRGKCFIEYIPAEYAWAPIEAEGYMYIDCFWVSGQFKGQGNSNLLLDACIKDSREKGKKGLCVLSSAKKKPFLSDGGYLTYKGFVLADNAEPFFELLYLPFDDNAERPRFREQAKKPHIDEKGLVIFHSDQCPFTAKYVPILAALAKEKGVELKTVHFSSAKEAQNAPAAATAYNLFCDGEFVTHELYSEKKFAAFIDEYQAAKR